MVVMNAAQFLSCRPHPLGGGRKYKHTYKYKYYREGELSQRLVVMMEATLLEEWASSRNTKLSQHLVVMASLSLPFM